MKAGVILGLMVLIVGAGVWGYAMKDKTTVTPQENMVMQPTITMTRDIGELRYVEYSSGVLDKHRNVRRLLFFYADWCSTCRPADADIAQNADKIPADLAVIRVNYKDSQTDDEEKALADKYQVTYQHTFVQIGGDDKVVTKWNGGKFTELIENIR